jgi:hypothetical protein
VLTGELMQSPTDCGPTLDTRADLIRELGPTGLAHADARTYCRKAGKLPATDDLAQ